MPEKNEIVELFEFLGDSREHIQNEALNVLLACSAHQQVLQHVRDTPQQVLPQLLRLLSNPQTTNIVAQIVINLCEDETLCTELAKLKAPERVLQMIFERETEPADDNETTQLLCTILSNLTIPQSSCEQLMQSSAVAINEATLLKLLTIYFKHAPPRHAHTCPHYPATTTQCTTIYEVPEDTQPQQAKARCTGSQSMQQSAENGEHYDHLAGVLLNLTRLDSVRSAITANESLWFKELCKDICSTSSIRGERCIEVVRHIVMKWEEDNTPNAVILDHQVVSNILQPIQCEQNNYSVPLKIACAECCIWMCHKADGRKYLQEHDVVNIVTRARKRESDILLIEKYWQIQEGIEGPVGGQTVVMM